MNYYDYGLITDYGAIIVVGCAILYILLADYINREIHND